MKKRLTAVLLTLCMVIGLLPLAALAATYEGTDAKGNKVTITTDDATGKVTAVDGDKNTYYQFDDVLTGDTDVFNYYTLEGVAGTLNVTLVKAQTWTVTFNVNLPEGVTVEVTAPNAQTVEDGKTATEPTALADLDKYGFVGWMAVAPDAAPETERTIFDFTTPITADTTLYAVWAASLTQEANIQPETKTEVKVSADDVAAVTDTFVELGAKAPEGASLSTVKTETVSIPVEAVAALGTNENIKTVNVTAATGTITLDANTLAAAVKNETGNVEFKIEKTADKAPADVAEAKGLPEGAEAAEGAAVKTVEVSLTVGEKQILDGTGADVEVSVHLDMGNVSAKKLAMFYLGDVIEYYAVKSYDATTKMISWMTNHLSPWGAMELAVEITDGSDTPANKTLTVTDESTSYKVAFGSTSVANAYIVWDVELANGNHTANWAKIGSGETEHFVGKPTGAKNATAWIVSGTTAPVWSENGTLKVGEVTAWGTTKA